eukprot:7834043-Prorocentrum_lima.AAC.1
MSQCLPHVPPCGADVTMRGARCRVMLLTHSFGLLQEVVDTCVWVVAGSGWHLLREVAWLTH